MMFSQLCGAKIASIAYKQMSLNIGATDFALLRGL